MSDEQPRHRLYYSSPIGIIELTAADDALVSLYFVERQESTQSAEPLLPLLQQAREQLQEYFAGRRQVFDLPLAPRGSNFQMKVWRELRAVPYGKTVSYLDIARALGDPKAVRAVGNANGKNPISIIIPCHRVIGRDGKLIGYGGGLWRKEWLLKHEGALII